MIQMKNVPDRTNTTRRYFLKQAIAGSVSALAANTIGISPVWANADTEQRIVIADGALAETALAMGITPIAMADIAGYRTWIQLPPVPETVISLGTRFQPNLERIVLLKPDLILTSGFYAGYYASLRDIAPIETFDIYTRARSPLENAVAAAKLIGTLTGQNDAARKLIAETFAKFSQIRQRLAQRDLPPVIVSNLLTSRHMRVFGQSSLMQAVMDEIGVRNGWNGPTNSWGFATITLTQLAQHTESALMAFEPVPQNVSRSLDRSPIFTELPQIRQYGLTRLPPCGTFGGLHSAGRFAEILMQCLLDLPSRNGLPS
ncbi:MAG: ABC transporter substrate-binding protein [Thalassospira sp.]|nr:ABC transporter substrate-binding protein [Thalassospira sp.]